VVWIADLKPDEAAQDIGPMIEHALKSMKQTLEAT
jgi:hypothetical protein